MSFSSLLTNIRFEKTTGFIYLLLHILTIQILCDNFYLNIISFLNSLSYVIHILLKER